MPTPSSSTVHRPLGPAALFVLVLVIAAFVIIGLMRVVTPVKERMNGTSTSPVATTTKPGAPIFDETDGKPGNDDPGTSPTSTSGIVRPRPTGAVCDEQNFICITAPVVNATAGNPLQIQGTAIAFENTVQYELIDGGGARLASGFVTANAPDIGRAGSFETRIFWDRLPAATTGTLVMYESSARDGRPIHTVRVPVRFSSVSAVSRTVYLIPEGGQSTDCSVVQAQRVSLPSTTLPVEATLRALLELDQAEVRSAYPGFATAIPAGTRIVSLKVVNGVATVVFSSQLEAYGGGSCNVAAIRAQIESTLKQFSSVRSVVLSVEGKTPEESLQP